jgi:hypothetical protein
MILIKFKGGPFGKALVLLTPPRANEEKKTTY